MKNKIIKLKINKVTLYIVSAVIVFLILFSLFIHIYFLKDDIINYHSYKNENIYFYLQEAKYEYNSKFEISQNNEIVTFTTKGFNHEFDSEPIFYKDEKKVLLTNDMSVVFTKDNFRQLRLTKYSSIVNNSKNFTIEYGKFKYDISDAFLYDGKDTYFFLNDTSINVNGKKYKLGAFSYVIYNYNKEIYIYNYNDDKMIYLTNVDSAVTASYEGFNINIGTDSIIYDKGSKLLMKNLDYLPKLQEQ